MTVTEGVAGAINILTNDDFLPGANTTLVDAGTGTALGVATFDASTGEITYISATGEGGTVVTVDYSVCNTAETPNVCGDATVTITVLSETNEIVAVDDLFELIVTEEYVVGDVIQNDSSDDDILNITEFNGVNDENTDVTGTYGILDWSTGGSFTYYLDVDNEDINNLANEETLTESFTYKVTNGSDNSATAILSITIIGSNTIDPIIVSDGFSPNGDGVNDEFVIKNIEDYPNNELYIYNRWGTEVYTQKNYNNTWEGRSDRTDEILPVGTYFYVLTVDGKKEPIKGYVYIKY